LAFILLERFMQKFGISDHQHWHGEDEEESTTVTEKRELENAKGKDISTMKHSTGYLNLISSLLHNFIDGLAIGIAFNLGNPREFIPVTVGIIAHEIPR
jgi:zinc transporter ZupT